MKKQRINSVYCKEHNAVGCDLHKSPAGTMKKRKHICKFTKENPGIDDPCQYGPKPPAAPVAGHTPTPWHVLALRNKLYVEAPGVSICDMMLEDAIELKQSEVARADAAFIVRAVNSHEDMLEVLKIVALFDPNNPSALVQMCAVRNEAKRAIAQAEGK